MVRRARRRIAAAAGFLMLGTGMAIAQSGDPIATRKALMKENDGNALAVVRMARGLMPFDPVKVDAAFAQWADTAKRFPGLFPESSKMGENTRAASMIWVNRKDFDAKAAEFGKAVADNRAKATASLAGLRAAIPVIGNA